MNVSLRNDGYMNLLSGLGAPGLDRTVSGGFIGSGWRRGLERYWTSRFSAYNLGEYYFSHGVAQSIVDRPADDSLQRGVEIEGDTDEVAKVEYDRLGLLAKVTDAIRWARLYGGSIILLIAKDGGELNEPLDLNNLETIIELRVYDITCLKNPGIYYSDPNDPDNYGKIEVYTITPPGAQSFDVHETRLIPIEGEPTPTGYNSVTGIPWFGRSVLEGCLASLEKYYQALEWSVRLIERKQQAIYNMAGLGEMFANGDDEIVAKRINMVDLVRGNLNSVVVDKDDSYNVLNLGLDGLQSLINEFQVTVAADSKIPIVILFGKSTTGLNTTGAGDLESYYGMVSQIQKDKVKPVLEKLTSVVYIQKTLPGKIPDEWDIVFNPLWQPSELEQSQTDQAETTAQANKINALITLMNNEILSPEEVRKIVINEIYDEYDFTDTLPSTGGDVDYAEGVDTSMLDVPQDDETAQPNRRNA